jgi:hypothetical protein
MQDHGCFSCIPSNQANSLVIRASLPFFLLLRSYAIFASTLHRCLSPVLMHAAVLVVSIPLRAACHLCGNSYPVLRSLLCLTPVCAAPSDDFPQRPGQSQQPIKFPTYMQHLHSPCGYSLAVSIPRMLSARFMHTSCCRRFLFTYSAVSFASPTRLPISTRNICPTVFHARIEKHFIATIQCLNQPLRSWSRCLVVADLRMP